MPQTVAVKPGLDIPIHSGKKLFVEFGSLGGQMPCTCVGVVNNTHIIIRPPAGMTVPMVNVSENVSVVVKYLDGGTIYGFRSTIEHVVLRPYLLLFVAHPYSAEELELRRDIRCPCFVAMNCRIERNDAEIYGFIVDINRYGCRLVATRFVGDAAGLAEDEPIRLTFVMSSIEIVGLRCILRTVCKDATGGVFGVKFADSHPHAEMVIEDYVANYKAVMQIQDAHLKTRPAACSP